MRRVKREALQIKGRAAIVEPAILATFASTLAVVVFCKMMDIR